MSSPNWSLLAVAVSDEVFACVEETLSGTGFFAERVTTGAEALELASQLPYDAIIISFPLPDTSVLGFLGSVRRGASASQRSAIVLVTAEAHLAAAGELVGQGANRVVTEDGVEEALRSQLLQLVDVQPRLGLRSMTRLKIQLEWGASTSVCQTVNVSASGMLIRTDHDLPAGTSLSFDLTLPGESGPIRGVAVVVRHAGPVRENIKGVGVRFASFEGSDKARLGRWLAAHKV